MLPKIDLGVDRMSAFGIQGGFQHESNGKSGEDSRALNIAYIRPIITFGDPGNDRGFFIAIAPRAWAYLGWQDDNPDIEDYRGYSDLKIVGGWRDGLFSGNLDFYLHAQYFTGYGESLIEYDKKDWSARIGLSLVR